MISAEEVITKMKLIPLPEEGGYYRETYRSEEIKAPASIFGIKSDKPRVVNTAIYYLIKKDSFSALHRIKSDEVFHFYSGDPVEMIQFNESGNINRFILGANIFKEETPQVVVPKNNWQALRLVEGGSWALLGTTVSPGFEFEDFEVGHRDQMLKLFPQIRSDIIRFSREPNEKVR